MKGAEYLQDKDHHLHPHRPNSSIMFSKLHHTHKFPATPLPYQSPEEHESRPSPLTALPGDGDSIEVVRRPRGRPPGSKNKPKPPVIITREPEPSMSPYILELSGGNDIVESLTRFCRKRNTGLCVLSASGAVLNVTLRQPSATPGATVTFHGRFDILSLSSTILPVTAGSMAPPPPASGCFTISLGGPQGQIVGGMVVGPLLAAGTVYLIASSFNNPVFQRLPLEQDVRDSGGGSGNEGQSQSAVSGGGGEDGGGGGTAGAGHGVAGGDGSCGGMSVFGSHMGSDVIWGGTTTPSRQPPPHY